MTTYTNFWETASESYTDGNYAEEAKIVKELQKLIKHQVVCDLACGDGRLCSDWVKLGAAGIVFADISDGIYLAARRYKKLETDAPAIFLKTSYI